MTEPHVLIVTSHGADPAVVVPVLAACEAAGMRVRAIDLGSVGAGGGGLSDRVRRALLGESAERRLRKEIDGNPPDVTLAFDPYACCALSVARDQAGNPTPVVAVVGELDPAAAWSSADADRYCVVDDEAAVALADVGVEEDRILVAGPIGERVFADAGGEDRGALRGKFGLSGRVVVVEVAEMGAELTGQVALQLSLADISDGVTYLFDAGGDAEAAGVLRRQVPVLGLRAKLFGNSSDAARYWRAADVVVARPRPRAVARAHLVGARLLALVDDEVAGAAKVAEALESRGRGAGARGVLLLSSGVEGLLRSGGAVRPADDGALGAVEVAWVVASERRAVIDERRSAAREETHSRLRDATAAASAAARVHAMPGDLEDLGGAPAPAASVPAEKDLDALRRDAAARKEQLLREVDAARRAAESADPSRAERERAAMHRLLQELADLDREMRDLDAATRAARAAGARPGADPAPPPPRPRSAGGDGGRPRPPPEDPLADLRRKASRANRQSSASIDDELAALKRRMSESPRKKR